MNNVIWILKFEPDSDDSGLGADVEVFKTQEAAWKFAHDNYTFTSSGSPTGSAETIPEDEDDYPRSGRIDIYSSFIRE